MRLVELLHFDPGARIVRKFGRTVAAINKRKPR
jgi:hypothetical protein